MSMTDPIADMLTRIRNANRAKHKRVDIPRSNIKVEVAKVLLREKFISKYRVIDDGRHGTIRMYLRYTPSGDRVITNLKRVSTSGLRRYVGRERIPRVYDGLGTAILSTSKGILTDKEARKAGIGGELLCYVW
ncbi:MAG: 30S ribosomal protein S8 [Candidatus Latescibacterota bacterium]|nr:MAG: 30S ribosomal protein S8 [Candidatus Latescibacterota bacterium]